MINRPHTQGKKPLGGIATARLAPGLNRAQTAAMQTAQPPSQYASQAIMRKSTQMVQKNRIFQKPFDHSDSFTSANLKIKQMRRDLSGNVNNRNSQETNQSNQYKLDLSKTDLALKKLRKNMEGRNNQAQARTAIRPDDLAEVRDQHLMESSISSVPKTTKSGLFENVAKSSSPQMYNS